MPHPIAEKTKVYGPQPRRRDVRPVLNPGISPQDEDIVLNVATEIFNYEGKTGGISLPDLKFELVFTRHFQDRNLELIKESVRSLGGHCVRIVASEIQKQRNIRKPRFFLISNESEMNRVKQTSMFPIFLSLVEGNSIFSMLHRFFNRFHCDENWPDDQKGTNGFFVLCQAIWLFQLGYRSFGRKFEFPTHPRLSHRRLPPQSANSQGRIWFLPPDRTLSIIRPFEPSKPIFDNTQTCTPTPPTGGLSNEILFPGEHLSIEERIEHLTRLENLFKQLAGDPVHNFEKLRQLAQFFKNMNEDTDGRIRGVVREFPERVRPTLFDVPRGHWEKFRALRDRKLLVIEVDEVNFVMQIYKFIFENIKPGSLKIEERISYLDRLLQGDIRTHCWKCREEFWRSERPYCNKCGGNICATVSCRSCLCSYRGRYRR